MLLLLYTVTPFASDYVSYTYPSSSFEKIGSPDIPVAH